MSIHSLRNQLRRLAIGHTDGHRCPQVPVVRSPAANWSRPWIRDAVLEEQVRVHEGIKELHEGPLNTYGDWFASLCLGLSRLPELAPEVMKDLLVVRVFNEVAGSFVCTACGLEFPFRQWPELPPLDKTVAGLPIRAEDPPEFFSACPHCGGTNKEIAGSNRVTEQDYPWKRIDVAVCPTPVGYEDRYEDACATRTPGTEPPLCSISLSILYCRGVATCWRTAATEFADGTDTVTKGHPLPCVKCGQIPECVLVVIEEVVASRTTVDDGSEGRKVEESQVAVIGGNPDSA